MSYRRLVVFIPILILLLPLSVAFADSDFEITLTTETFCDEVDFTIDIDNDNGPYTLSIKFGDTDNVFTTGVESFPVEDISHTYPEHGEYEVSIKVVDADGLEGELEQKLIIDGPQVTLESDPSPPLLTFDPEGVTVGFTAVITGGEAPFQFDWDLDADGTPDDVDDPASATASYTYTEAGKIKPSVKVTDACGFSDKDKQTVFIVDPSAEEEGEEIEDEEEVEEVKEEDTQKGCHPVAERIADVLNALSPDRVEGTYACEDIFNFFQSEEGEGGHKFGLLQHAYQMTQIIDELTWEDIVDWHMDGGGWGMLKQLDRFAETVEEIGIVELVELITSGENSIGEVRTAIRMTSRYDADIYEVLTRISEGGSTGEITQFYKLVQELELSPEEMDEYLSSGATFAELRHAWKYAERVGAEFDAVLDAHLEGNSWGDIKQANRMADDQTSAEAILEMGIQEYRKLLREQEREESRLEQDSRMALKLADHYGFDEVIVWAQFETCEGNWGCVRKALREQEQLGVEGSREERTAAQIAKQYDKTEADVMERYELCNSDWSCVRAYFREEAKGERGKGNK